jgi:hypothetical protein
MKVRVAAVCGLVLGCLICAGCRNDRESEPLRKSPVGSLVGEVRLAPGTHMPKFSSLDLLRKPLHVNALAPVPSECAAANEQARSAVTVSAHGMLGGVVVAASDFTRTRVQKPRTYTVVLEHCRLQPSMIAATGGDTLTIVNRDAYGFEPLVGPAYQARALPPGKPWKVPLIAAGIDSLQCSLGAPCGRTDLMVFFHPVHAVTDAIGRFHIDNFPASELVRVSAWHPLFESAESFVWLDPGQQGSLSLELKPRERFVSDSDREGTATSAKARD